MIKSVQMEKGGGGGSESTAEMRLPKQLSFEKIHAVTSKNLFLTVVSII